MSTGSELIVVLHQVRSPGNLGAVARIMANFGFRTLVLSDPVTSDLAEAERLAVRGGQVLEGLRVVEDVREAIANTVYACGTTFRAQVGARRALTPEQAALRLNQEARRGPVALVFGGERRGMSDEELAACQDFLTIPTRPEQPSMNLAQSAAVLLYLCAHPPAPGEAGTPGAGDDAAGTGERASLRLMQALEERMRLTLLEAGFLNPQEPERILRELWHSLSRGALTPREAEMWLNAFKHLARAMGSPPPRG